MFQQDDHNCAQNFNAFQKLFQDSYQGRVKPMMTKSEFDLTPLILALNDQIKSIESRLMNCDTDRMGTHDRQQSKMEGLTVTITVPCVDVIHDD